LRGTADARTRTSSHAVGTWWRRATAQWYTLATTDGWQEYSFKFVTAYSSLFNKASSVIPSYGMLGCYPTVMTEGSWIERLGERGRKQFPSSGDVHRERRRSRLNLRRDRA
jgi:hypothetical protein